MSKCRIRFGDRVTALLEELADQKGTTKSEVVRHALAMYKYLHDKTSGGDKRTAIISVKDDRILEDIIM